MKVKNTILKYSMLSRGDHVLAGISGGPDSVCLLVLLQRLKEHLGIHLSAAYINHGLRPDEIPHEIGLCEGLCNTLGVPFSVRDIDVKAFMKAHKINKQEAARELRYSALGEIAEAVSASKIALGHTADDQAETVIMRLVRGAGPLGLSGIPPVRDALIRPLIGIERKEIEHFLRAEQLVYHTDSSNLKDAYMRNKIRHTVLPALQGLGADAVMTIARTADIFREEDAYFELQVTKALIKLISRKTGTALELFLMPLENMDKALLRRIIRRAVGAVEGLRGMGYIHIEEILELVKRGMSGDRICLPGGIRAIKGYSTLVITADMPSPLKTYTLEGPGEIAIIERSLMFNCTPLDFPPNSPPNHPEIPQKAACSGKHCAVFDAGKLRYPLVIRSRKPGDYFYPSGFGKKKKLQDYFVDEKVLREERDNIPLLVSDNKLAWVVGYRADERFLIDKNTVSALKCEIRSLKT